MKLCSKHHDELSGDGDCFQCVINELRQVINESQAENQQLKKLLSENGIQIPQQ